MKKIILAGFGTVGQGIYEIINNTNLKNDVEISNILVRDVKKYESMYQELNFTNDIDSLDFSKNDIFIEVIGDMEISKKLIIVALEHKVNVITANKALISQEYKLLQNIAKRNGVNLFFEASVGGSLPIINLVNTNYKYSDIQSLDMIINGTTNFILSKCKQDNLSYEQSLKMAQDLGFAESDPSSDVLGLDAAHKTVILGNLIFGLDASYKDISCEGITSISEREFKYANNNDYTIKLIASLKNQNDILYPVVRPCFVKNTNIMSQVSNEFNIVNVEATNTTQTLIAQGAGKLPTANSIISDLNNLLNNKISQNSSFDLKSFGKLDDLTEDKLVFINDKVEIEKNTTNLKVKNKYKDLESVYTIIY